jgi:hypothetical protein
MICVIVTTGFVLLGIVGLVFLLGRLLDWLWLDEV